VTLRDSASYRLVLCHLEAIVRMRRPAVLLSLLMSLALTGAPSHAAGSIANGPAPDFALPALRGGNVRLSEYRGQVVVLTFWSSRCSSCAQQLSALSEQQETYGPAGLVTLAISVDSDLPRARTFATQLLNAGQVSIPMLLDAERAVGRIYGIDRLPTTVLIDRSGRVRHLIRDYRRTDNSYISQLRALLDDSGSAAALINETGFHS
jgi:peroxiredoxin